MTINSYVILVAFLLLVTSPYLLRRFSQAKTASYGAFAVGSRNFGWFRITAGLSATFIGGASVINLAGLGYSFGWYALTDVIATSLALFISAVFVVPLLIRRRAISLGQYLEGSGKFVSLATGLLTTIVYTLVTAAQIVALTRILKPYFPLPIWALAIVACFGITAYIIYGGYSAVTVTDVIQFIVMGLFYVGFVGVQFYLNPSISTPSSIPPKSMPLDMIVLLSLPLLFVPASQDLHIRVNSASSESQARGGVGLSGLCYFLFCFISVRIGMRLASDGKHLLSPDDAAPVFFSEHFGSLSIIPTLAVIAAVISTLDSVLFASASSLSYDFWDRIRGAPLSGKDSARPRLATLIILVAALFIALAAQGILGLILSALVIYVAVLFPVLVGRALRKNSHLLGILALTALICVTVLETTKLNIPFRAFAYAGIHLMAVLVIPHEKGVAQRATD